ncbi:SRPBCC family protein [Nonomuraea sp. NPDC050536]|uniref:SRPBCC family protein n=1 Tax=Nonomuraea sp. NPDC050536 TaxID=3364366 RepID=UPI0037C5957A
MFDMLQQLNAVRRAVGAKTVEAGEVRTVTVSQTYNAEVEEVWDACTNVDRIPRWFLPIKGELRLGGHYQLEGNAGGTIEQCDPPRTFSATWEFAGGISWIEVRLTPEGDGRTRFELEHLAPKMEDARWLEYGPGAVGIGWDMAIMGLAIHLSGAAPLDPQEAMAMMMSEEGRQFTVRSSELWAEANIAFGTPEADARAAAERCVAFYTAPPAQP